MKLKITQIKSSIGYKIKAKRTLEALGIKKMNSHLIHNDIPQIRRMINTINYLLKVDEQ